MRFVIIGALVGLALVGFVTTQANAHVSRPANLSCVSC